MITLLTIGTIVAAMGQFADAYTTNKNIARGFKESNSFFVIQWLAKHPRWNLIVKTASGVLIGAAGLLASHISQDISTVLGLQIGFMIGTVAFAEEGFRAAYHNYKLGKA